MESHCNGKGRKLSFGGMRRHRGDRERNREVKERGRKEVRQR